MSIGGMHMTGIYLIRNLQNNKVYIGQSVNIERRFRDHKNRTAYTDYETPLYKAFRKYGVENFSFEILEECLSENLDEREIFYISKYKSTQKQFGYNLTNGGKGYSGTHSEEHIRKVAEAQRGKPHKKPSAETLAKRSASLRGLKKPKSFSEKMSKIHKGKEISEETRRKISQSLKGRKLSEETKAKLRETNKHIVHTEEARKKISDKVSKAVLQFDKDGNFVNEYKNARIASEETGTRFSSISSCCHGKYKSANGYVWKFKEKGSD